MPDTKSLQQPITEGGIESVNFFNGRLLTGQDMAREQTARRTSDARLGTAIGTGIAHGLETSRAAPDALPGVTVQPGLAINSLGQTLRLAQPETIRLSRLAVPGPTGPLGFGDCAPALSGTYLAGEGTYILTLAPAAVMTGRAQNNGLGNTDAPCNTDAEIAAVQFRLLEIHHSLIADLDPTTPDFRNRLAYRCFGAGILADWHNALLAGSARTDDLLAAMAAHGLSPHEVPLAIIGFTGIGNADNNSADFNLLDTWAVRRPLAHPDAPASWLGTQAAPRRHSVARAMIHQFQAHLSDLTGPSAAIGRITARAHFPYLPPVGILPHASPEAGLAFFSGMTIRGPVHINAEQVEALIAESFDTPAIRSADDSLVWLYAVAGNRLSQRLPLGSPDRADRYLIFASGHLPYRADARFNLHRFDAANIALGR